MEFIHIMLLMLPIIIPIGIGFVFTHFGIFTPKTGNSLLKFLLYITFPGVILSNLSHESTEHLFQLNYILATITITIGMYFITYILHKFIFRRTMEINAVAALCVAFVSSGIVGIPIMDNIIGLQATLLPVILNTMLALVTVVPITILFIKLHKGHKHNVLKTVGLTLLDAIKNPLVASSIVGLALIFLHIQLPDWLNTTFSKLGSATFATALVTVGIGINIKTLQKDLSEILFLSFLRVVISTIFGFGLALLFQLPAPLAVAFVMIVSLPTAKSVPALAEGYDVFVSDSLQIVTITTLLMLIVMPIVVIAANSIWPGVVR